MTNKKPKHTFIPYRRSDVVKLCLQDDKLNEDDQQTFKTFCEILRSYYHFSFHAILERLKDHFMPTDPDTPFKKIEAFEKESDDEKVKAFFDDFQHLLDKAGYHTLSEKDLKAAFKDRSLIHLDVNVDFDAFDRFLFYYRGTQKTTIKKKVFYFKEKEITFDTLERVILLLKFKDESYFQGKKKRKVKHLNFVPGRTYIFFFKNVPKADLEILFPNVRIRMTWKDRLMFLLPALGAGISTLFKISANILILIGAILITLKLTSIAERLGVTPEQIPSSVVPLIATLASILVVLGGFAIKQYMNYKNKFVEFMNDVTQTLFFKSISVNAGVFQCLIDAAEEEECKEALLAYYHLLTAGRTFTKEELDQYIENWFVENHQTHVDFDVEDALEKLKKLKSTIEMPNGKVEERAIVERNDDGTLQVLPLDQSIRVLDCIWDNIFRYNGILEL